MGVRSVRTVRRKAAGTGVALSWLSELGAPRETAGKSAEPKACNRLRASSLPDLDLARVRIRSPMVDQLLSEEFLRMSIVQRFHKQGEMPGPRRGFPD